MPRALVRHGAKLVQARHRPRSMVAFHAECNQKNAPTRNRAARHGRARRRPSLWKETFMTDPVVFDRIRRTLDRISALGLQPDGSIMAAPQVVWEALVEIQAEFKSVITPEDASEELRHDWLDSAVAGKSRRVPELV
jgi:hypothetical protein